MLVRHVNRLRRAQKVNEVVVATTNLPEDDAIVALCQDRGWAYFRGAEMDVLSRYYGAACEYAADIVVRVTSDCPLIDPDIVDDVIASYKEIPDLIDYASNVFPERTFPRGLDVEVMAFEALVRATREDDNKAWREHVTVYLQRHPELFTTRNLLNDVDYSHMRWTVDTEEDLAFVRKIYDHYGHDGFSWQEVLRLLDRHPDWLKINSSVKQKVVV